MTTTMMISVSRVLAEMEGWEGIGQEELAALRHQVGTHAIRSSGLWQSSLLVALFFTCGSLFHIDKFEITARLKETTGIWTPSSLGRRDRQTVDVV